MLGMKALRLKYRQMTMPNPPYLVKAEEESYFATCERDEQGRCLPSGQGGKEADDSDAEEEDEEWDGSIEQNAVEGTNRRSLEAEFTLHDGRGNYFDNNVYIVTGKYDPFPDDPHYNPVSVYRWESRDALSGELSGVDGKGEWTADRQDAEIDGRLYAAQHHEDEPDEEDDEEPDEEDDLSVKDHVDESEFAYAEDINELFQQADDDYVVEILGALSDSTVRKQGLTSHKGAYGFDVEVSNPKLKSCERFIGIDSDGEKFISNELFVVKPEYRAAGLGSQIFSSQVEQAIKQGFQYIHTHAAGDISSSMNGYYTWVMLGYDESIESLVGHSPILADRIKKVFPEAESIQDVIEVNRVELGEEAAAYVREKAAEVDKKLNRPVKNREVITGADWWLVHGGGLEDARFDLTEGSRSRQRLDAYMAERAKRKEQQNA